MWQLALESLWLTAAVAVTGVAHMFAVKRDIWPALKVPIDRGLRLGGARIFGDNKTWRGVVFMTVVSGAVGAVQGLALGRWAERAGVACLDFDGIGAADGAPGALGHAVGYAVVATVLGFGYALGELPNSFLKRRVHIPPGKTVGGVLGAVFFVVDQVDSVIVALVLCGLLFPVGWAVVGAGVLTLGLLHFVIVLTLFLAGVRRNL